MSAIVNVVELERRRARRRQWLLIAAALLAVTLAAAALAAWLAYRVCTFPFRLALLYRYPAMRRRRRGHAGLEAKLALLSSLGTALFALWETRDLRMLRGFHLCENPQCRRPIPNSSRAKLCSNECRGHVARLRNQDDSNDDDDIPF